MAHVTLGNQKPPGAPMGPQLRRVLAGALPHSAQQPASAQR